MALISGNGVEAIVASRLKDELNPREACPAPGDRGRCRLNQSRSGGSSPLLQRYRLRRCAAGALAFW